MKTMKPPLFSLTFVLAFAIFAAAADKPALRFEFATYNVQGATGTWDHGINNAGIVVGAYQVKSGACYGFILDAKKLTKLNDPSGSCTDAYNLNPNGSVHVVGNFYDKSGQPEGFLYTSGKFSNIPGPPGAGVSLANGINDKGDVVGTYIDASNVVHGFLLTGKKYTTLDVPGSGFTVATGINDAGTIVLYWVSKSGGPYNAAIFNGKTYKTINVPGARASIATALSKTGDIAYFWYDAAGNTHSALRHNGTVYKFDPPKAAGSYAWGINDNGQIAGGYSPQNSSSVSGYIATYK